MRSIVLSSACIFLSNHCCGDAANWPQFRGPNGNAIVMEDFPTEWSADTNVRWHVESPGEGWSAPVIWKDRLFMTAAVMTKGPDKSQAAPPARSRGRGRGGYRNNMASAEFRWEVRCLNTATGELLWTQTATVGKPPAGRHMQNTYASETPVTDGERVYAYFGMKGVHCFDMDGNLQWTKDLGNFEMRNDWGTSSSPVLFDGMLYLQIDSQEQSFIVALDGKSGDEVWRQNRAEPSQYSSPIVWKNSQRAEIVTCAQSARSYDPTTGKLLWELWLEGGRSSATPLAVGDRLYLGSELRNRGGDDDGGGYLFAVNAGANGSINKDDDHVAWALPRSGIQMASPVLCAGHLYLFERRRGVLHCIKAETGEMAYEIRVKGARAFWSSPWVHEDKVYCVDSHGTTHIIQGGPEYGVVGTNELDQQVWSTPAIADGAVFVRTTESLFCIGPRS